MKYRTLYVLLLLGNWCLAQPSPGKLTTYAGRRAFLDTLKIYLDNTSLPDGLKTLNRLQAEAISGGDPELAGELKLKYCSTIFNSPGNAADTMERVLKLLIAEAGTEGLPYLQVDAMQTLGEYYSNKHQVSAAIDQFIAAYDLYKNFDEKVFVTKMPHITSVGGAFYTLEDYDNALKYFKEVVSLMKSSRSNEYLYCSVYNTIGLCYRNKKQFDSAVHYFQLCYDQAASENYLPYQGIAAGNIGITFFLQHRYNEAIPLLQKDIETSVATNQIQNAAASMSILATIYNENKEFDKAETLLKKALEMVENKPFWPVYKLAAPIYKQLYIVYASKKDYRKAWLYADSTLIAKDSLSAQNNSLALAKAHDKLEYTQHKLESTRLQDQINLARVELSNNRKMMLVAIGGIGFLLVVIIFIARLNKKVSEQNQELEKLNNVKDRIFSIIGHDLRAPVNTLVSFTQLLENGAISPEKFQKYTGVLKDTLGHTAGLMENLINWARTQMQGYNPVTEKFDLAEIAAQCTGLLTPEAAKKGVSLTHHIPTGTVVNSDFNIVSLVIRNLLSNAIKFTPPGGSISLTALVTPFHIQVKVADTGIGISRELVTKFNKNSSGQPLGTTPGTNKEKGTGLGLMLCKDFAVLLKGRLTLDSETGKGSTFIFDIPV